MPARRPEGGGVGTGALPLQNPHRGRHGGTTPTNPRRGRHNNPVSFARFVTIELLINCSLKIMLQDFRGQNLQGRSFKNQNLINTDFSGADIRGADFTRANLAGANFNKATAGLAPRRVLVIVIIAAALSGIGGAASTFAPEIIDSSLIPQYNRESIFIPNAIVLFLVMAYLSVAIVRQDIQKALGYFTVTAVVSVALISVLGGISSDKHPILSWMRNFRLGWVIAAFNGEINNSIPSLIVNLITIAFGSMTVVIALSLAIALAAVVGEKKLARLVIFEAVAAGGIATFFTIINATRYLKVKLLIKAGMVDNINNQCSDFFNRCAEPFADPPLVIAIIAAAVILALAWVGLGIYVASRVLAEDDKYALIRQLAVVIAGVGGTSFRRANLTNANFSHATLKNTDFTQSNITRTLWHKSLMLDWAIPGETILNNPAVRDLLVSRNGREKSYEQANLRGANLSDADLFGINLRNADLTDATFQAANLEQANLTQVQAISADFSNAQMTGVCGLGSWNIDSTTNLEWADSRWIYLLEDAKPETDDRERRPHNGEFAPGEFTNFFQEVTNTVDLIFRRGLDATAFNESFRQVQVQNEGTPLQIQAIENKGDGVVVVKVSVPATADKARIHQDFKQAYDEKLAALDARYQADLNSQSLQIERIKQEQINNLALIQQLTAKKPDRLVVITIEKAPEDRYLTVRVNIWSDDGYYLPINFKKQLPPPKEILALYRQWQTQYKSRVTSQTNRGYSHAKQDIDTSPSMAEVHSHTNLKKECSNTLVPPLSKGGLGGVKEYCPLANKSHHTRFKLNAIQWQSLVNYTRKYYKLIPAFFTYRPLSSETDTPNFYRIKINKNQTTNFSVKDLKTSAEQLESSLNTWLKSASFHEIELILRQNFDPKDEVRIAIQTEDDFLWRLPWNCWNFLADYQKAEIAFSGPNNDRIVKNRDRTQLRILAIFGDSTGLDLNADKETLKSLPAQVDFLEQPSREEFDRYLGDARGWDILCFSGHSYSEADSSKGFIHINSQEQLTIEELKEVFSGAISRNLQLAIFNSCDGLGLARQLADLYLPQMIVMREPVPDRAAQEFLKSFLRYYASGNSLYVSLRQARNHLQNIEGCPYASWLPAIWQNLAEIPQNWERLSDSTN